MGVKPEHSGWRDQELSARHRFWGWDCPMLDLDFVCLEFDSGLPVCLVEYKRDDAAIRRTSEHSYRALIDLGNGYRQGIPVFGVRYARDFTWFQVVPLNPKAKGLVSRSTVMTEASWVTLLYRMRGREIPELLLGVLNNG